MQSYARGLYLASSRGVILGSPRLWWSGLQSFKVETPLHVTACLVSLHGHTVVPASGSRITLPCTCVHKFGCGCVSRFLCVHT